MAALAVRRGAATPTASRGDANLDGADAHGRGTDHHRQRQDRRAEHRTSTSRPSATSRPSTSSPAPRTRTPSATPLTDDGKWTVTADASAPYKTRIVVYRPIDPKQFDGTVMVEWLNVSGGLDTGANWTLDARRADPRGHTSGSASPRRRSASSAAEQAGRVAGAARTPIPVRYGSLEPPGRRVLLRHLLAGRPGGAQGPGDRARRPEAEAAHRGRRVAVGVLPHHATSNALARSDEACTTATSSTAAPAAPAPLDGSPAISTRRPEARSASAPTSTCRC